jgi:trigger factor
MSIQIVEKSAEGLSRVYGVTVLATDLAERVEKRIKEIAPQMQLKGFRPGKVPVAHVRRVHGKSILGEVIEQTLNETNSKILEDNKLRPAAQPDFQPVSDMDAVMNGTADLSYDLSLELMPDFVPVDPTTLELTRPVYKPADAEVDEALAELAGQNKAYEPRKGKAVKAKKDDLVVIDFIGRIDGVPFDGGTATDSDLVLGSGTFIPGFEDQLIGAKPDEVRTVSVNFPGDYQAPSLAGKAAEFEVTVKEVKAPAETTVDDAFAEKMGLSSLETLKDALRGQIEQQYTAASRFKLKRALLDVLDTKHDFPLPPRMVAAEFDVIWQQVKADKEGGGLSPEDEGKTDEQLQAEYGKIAERRVRLGLVLAEIGRTQNVVVTEQEMLGAMRQEAMRYRGQEQQVFDFFRNNPNAQAQLRAPLYEDKVVDLIFDKAKVTDQEVSKEELLKDDDMPEGYAES